MSDDPIIGKVIQGRYKVTGVLGQGGMGAVYRAEQTAMGRQVAVKMLRREFGQDVLVSERFVREARNSARLEHPNTVRVFDFGKTDEGDLFLVMELLSGGELSDVIGEGVPPVRAIHIVRQIARSVAEAHNKGLVHRDLKPANINVAAVEGDDCFVKVLDFGLAKLTQTEDGEEKDQSLTSAGAALGTPLYMSPEQCAGIKVDNRCDIYALGCILFELLTGRPPFVGQSAVMTMTMHIRDTVPALQEVRPDRVFPPSLEQIIRKCMEKEVDDRFQKMEEVVAALDQAQQIMSGGVSGIGGSLPNLPANSAEFAINETVAPNSAVDLAQAVSAELEFAYDPAQARAPLDEAGLTDPSAPQRLDLPPRHPARWDVGDTMASQTGTALPGGASTSAVQSNVVGEMVSPSMIQSGIQPQHGTGRLLAAAVVLLALGGGGAFLALKSGNQEPAPLAKTPAKAVEKVVEPVKPAAPAPAKEEKVFIDVQGSPKGALVFFDDNKEAVGKVPSLKLMPAGVAGMKIEVSKRGYETYVGMVKRKDHKDNVVVVEIKLTKKKRKKTKSYDSFGSDKSNDYEGFD